MKGWRREAHPINFTRVEQSGSKLENCIDRINEDDTLGRLKTLMNPGGALPKVIFG